MEVSFSVYLLDDGDLPEGGELVATCKRTFEDAGYHRVELDEPVLFDGGQRYSVVVEQKAPDGTWRVTANTAANKEGAECISQWNGGSPYYVNGVVNRGESYLYDEAAGGWSDWRDVLDALAADPGQALNARCSTTTTSRSRRTPTPSWRRMPISPGCARRSRRGRRCWRRRSRIRRIRAAGARRSRSRSR